MSALKTADQLTFFCLASTAPLLRLIWPSRPHSGDRVAGQLLLQIACRAAARTGDDSAALHSDLLQELSVLIRSHRARAVLRRRAELAG